MLLALLLAPSLALADELRGVETDVAEPDDYQSAAAGRRVALVVGINDYEDAALGDLRFAAQDASDVAFALRKENGGTFDEVVQLPGDVRFAEIKAAFDELTAGLQRDDTFLFYFAGHGTQDDEDNRAELYLLPSDGHLIGSDDVREEVKATWYALAALQSDIERVEADTRIVIIDACYNGTGRSGMSQKTLEERSLFRGQSTPAAEPEAQRSDAYLFAAYTNEPAREDEVLGNGIFTHYLIQALNGAAGVDANRDDLFTVAEVHEYVADKTQERTEGAQTPWMSTTQVGQNRIVLAGDLRDLRAEEKARVYGALPANMHLRVGEDLRGAGVVDKGFTEIEIRDEGQILVDVQTYLRAGQRLDLADLVDRRSRFWLLGAGGNVTVPVGAIPTVQPWAGTLQASWWEADEGGVRVGRVVTLSGAHGPVGERDELLTAQGLAGVRLMWGQSLLLGPGLDVGVLWRGRPPPDYTRWMEVLAPTASATWLGDRAFVTLEASAQWLPLLRMEQERLIPTGRLVAGVRL
ncbi:MAG: caspase family protein [Alphaproteobacteria bacterium]|nr:caspase family protein [Alphaproteobacteria bacterium]